MRFPYWPVRVSWGGEVLVPGQYEDPIQWIDARDLAEFTISLCERGISGIYNVSEPPYPIGQMLDEVNEGLGAGASFTWIPEEFLSDREVLRLVNGMASTAIRMEGLEGYNQYNVDKAIGAGLTFRPAAVTARDIVEWYGTLAEEDRPRGRLLSSEREAEVLAEWHASQTEEVG
jgi:2'-hydroxyisoflavone reductase